MWNYRLVKVTYHKGTENEESCFEIREAYYNEDGSIWAITENPAAVFGESAEEVKVVYERFGLAFQKEVIDLDTFVPAELQHNSKNDAIDIDLDENEFDKQFSEELKDLDS